MLLMVVSGGDGSSDSHGNDGVMMMVVVMLIVVAAMIRVREMMASVPILSLVTPAITRWSVPYRAGIHILY